MSLSYEGIGASLQSIDDYVTIMEILPGGSAQENGELKANDRILAVGQGKDGKMVDVVGWRLDDVVQLIRGPERLVRCGCRSSRAMHRPGAQEHMLVLPRKKITLEAQAAKKEIRKIKRGDKELKVGVDDGALLLPGLRRARGGRRRLPQHHARRAQAARRDRRPKAAWTGWCSTCARTAAATCPRRSAWSNLFVPKGPVVQLRETGGRVEVLEIRRTRASPTTAR